MKTAFILAAGRGERLKPLTLTKPKALTTIQGKPVIAYHLARLAQAKFERVVINHAYLGDQLRQYIGCGQKWGLDVHYSPEPPGGLETGGGIWQALPLLGPKPFIVINADIYIDYPFEHLTLPTASLAHLILGSPARYKAPPSFGLNDLGQVNNNKQLAYLGVAAFHPKAFDKLNMGRFSVVPLWRELAAHQQLTGQLYHGAWHDIGTIETLARAQKLVPACL
ncbi:MAG: mannose-1-phosphate guanylyltransferase [Legionellaceae bacterium]|nr:mannose-1-phosphate guanylyltransferase [Legionellaceae bacterium]HAF86991.1 nucleotidyltransferase family protein [Legionellales bacterium]HCA89648.1 nucleotidyltransferase family protein [Legionellales bacterium]|tara:strand:- start:75 stop:743 length:669 start_codon:yes stop_codon:yes gene_type:complete